MEVVFFKSQSELREWLEENHDKVRELWVGFYKKSSEQAGITYAEALDEALCFGWIDGVRKSVDEISYANRFTPRKSGSIWSMVNIKRANELVEAGLMQASGLKAFGERDEKKSKLYSYEERVRKLDDIYEEEFRANKEAWDFFHAQPAGYQRSAAWWVMSAKREETRLRRLATLIAGSQKGQRLVEVTGSAKTLLT